MTETCHLQAITIACPDCDLLNRVPELAPGESANCCRCDCRLSRFTPNCIDRVLALNLTAILLYAVACYFPFLSFGKSGVVVQTHLISGIVGLAEEGIYLLAAVVGFTTVVVPIFIMFALCYLLVPLKHGRRLPGSTWMFRWLMRLEPWNMVEIFMIGIIVAAVKLHKLANLTPDLAAYALMALIFVIAWMFNTLEPRIVWEKLERAR